MPVNKLTEIHGFPLIKNQEMQIRRVPGFVYFEDNLKFDTPVNSAERLLGAISAAFRPGMALNSGALGPKPSFIAKGESAVPFPGVKCEA
jgi:hypothetical protein